MESPNPNPKSFIPSNSKVSSIDCKSAFSKLESKERLYSFYLSRASWEGVKICFFQRSYESPALLYIFLKIFKEETPASFFERLSKAPLSFPPEKVLYLQLYIAAFFQNCGNYLGFGDTKFIPQISQEEFISVIKLSEAYKHDTENFEKVLNLILLETFTCQAPYGEIGFGGEEGLNGYYSPTLTKEEVEKVDEFLRERKISDLNTRIVKHGPGKFEVLIASVLKGSVEAHYKGDLIKITYGDFSPFLRDVIKNLEEAIAYANNDFEKNMLIAYIKHFANGDINIHKESQRYWIQNKGPIIETNIGFIETYLDPLKKRAEWEGFVALVDKYKSGILNDLVERAPVIIQNLPWPPEFEIEKFLKPDFTSLDVLTFATSGTPIGINLPNYDDITKNEGFKNVDLGNAYGSSKKEDILFATEDMAELCAKHYKPSLFVIVALHELLGHGTGKLFNKNENGTFNFDKDNLKNPLTSQLISTFYDVGETWRSKFGEISGAYEECKADAIALYLACFNEVLEVLLPSYSLEEREEILIVCWYQAVLNAIVGLKYYSLETKKFSQAHIAAGYAIMQAMIKHDKTIASFESCKKEGSDKPYFLIYFDHKRIRSSCKDAIGEFVKNLQIYKSIADVENGTKYFNQFLEVNEELLKLREIVLANTTPRKIELQHGLHKSGSDVEYLEFSTNALGVIESNIYNHGKENLDELFEEFIRNGAYFRK